MALCAASLATAATLCVAETMWADETDISVANDSPSPTGVPAATGEAIATGEAAKVDFATQIAPIFARRCVSCHGPDEPESGLRLDTRADALAGGYSGEAIVVGRAGESPLVALIAGTREDEIVMPPEGERLTDAEVALMRRWIDQGAAWPDGLTITASTNESQPAEPQRRDHWAFEPITDPAPPVVGAESWIRQPLDRFVLRRLEAAGIAPSPEADRATLIRRVMLDLVGLPPTPEEVRAFVFDSRPDAYERLVDRLLASPHYGERWARPWLDLCHFAESDGYLTDQLRPVAWRYRDWLIDALNRDLPFDEFTIQQLAGDLLPGATIDERLATGFLRNTLSNREGGADLEEFRVEQVMGRTEMLGTVWLGLTVGCARCHDHKYDPISQKEFFQLYAFFDAVDEVNVDAPLGDELAAHDAARAEYDRRRRELIEPVREGLEELQARWEAKLLEAMAHPGQDHVWDRQWEVLGLIWGGGLGEGQLEGTLIVQAPLAQRAPHERDRLLDYFLVHGAVTDDERYKELGLGGLREQLEALAAELPKLSRAPTIRVARVPHQTYLHVRGSFRTPGVPVDPDTPAIYPALPEDVARDRLALARWLVSDEHPTTARVTVNRAWQELFGRGLVETSGDFGTQGAEPTHPELLDWLASELRRQGWSMKGLHRTIVTSATYRQSSHARRELETTDPNNHLLARQSSLRLSAEQVRDAVLWAAGVLAGKIGGPSVFPPQPPSVSMEAFEADWKESEGEDRYRRGLYTFTRRQAPYAQNVTFDGADPSRACTRRERSNTPLQALTLLNDAVFFDAARALAGRVLSEVPADSIDWRIERMYEVCLSRPPTPVERARLGEYWHQQRALLAGADDDCESLAPAPLPTDMTAEEGAAWTGLASVMLNLHEFITRD
jgi:mono/diheme cytochrome c family protein